jgi:hypothetical protein
MLLRSQPLAPDVSKRFRGDEEIEAMSERNIKSQRIDKMFGDILDTIGKRKISLKKRIRFRGRRIKDAFYDLKYTIRNHKKWHKTMKALRPWEGFSGILDVMLTHLRDYVATEEQYGHAAEECKNRKIASARETIELLARMKEPEEYTNRRRKEVKAKYPEYKYLVTEYENGGTSYSGDFVAQGNGWAGMESGAEPREGYFEFVDGRFELAVSPEQAKTDRLLAEIRQYHEESHTAYEQAEFDSNNDFEKLGQLLKEHLYSWWD